MENEVKHALRTLVEVSYPPEQRMGGDLELIEDLVELILDGEILLRFIKGELNFISPVCLRKDWNVRDRAFSSS